MEQRVYLDESGMNDNETIDYGWSKKGKRLPGQKAHLRTKRISIISVLNQNKLIAPFVFEGMCSRDIFEIYIEKVLAPSLKRGQVVIMDNASFHKGGKIKILIEAAGCTILYLSSYSPDFNPIEHFWSSVKHGIKKIIKSAKIGIIEAACQFFGAIV